MTTTQHTITGQRSASTAIDHPDPIVAITNLTHRYAAGNGKAALTQVNLRIAPGEFVALLGPNASGKSTLFRIMATLTRPCAPQGASDAAVAIAGADVLTNPRHVRRHLGVVFQQPALDPMLTVMENLRCHGRLYGLSTGQVDQRCLPMLEAHGLSDRCSDLVGTLSGGLARRVELIKAMMHQPAVLLLDEPDAGLDVASQRSLINQLRTLADDGTTVIWTTHRPDDAQKGDRVIVLNQGQVIADDSPGNLVASMPGRLVTLEPQTSPVSLDDLLASVRSSLESIAIAGTPHIAGRSIRLSTHKQPVEVYDAVEAMAIDWHAVAIGRPSLEDVYLKLTGIA